MLSIRTADGSMISSNSARAHVFCSFVMRHKTVSPGAPPSTKTVFPVVEARACVPEVRRLSIRPIASPPGAMLSRWILCMFVMLCYCSRNKRKILSQRAQGRRVRRGAEKKELPHLETAPLILG